MSYYYPTRPSSDDDAGNILANAEGSAKRPARFLRRTREAKFKGTTDEGRAKRKDLTQRAQRKPEARDLPSRHRERGGRRLFGAGYVAWGGDWWSRARALVTNLAKRWARVKMRSAWRRRMASLGISSLPMPRAVAPARMKFAAVCWLTPPLATRGKFGNGAFRARM